MAIRIGSPQDKTLRELAELSRGQATPEKIAQVERLAKDAGVGANLMWHRCHAALAACQRFDAHDVPTQVEESLDRLQGQLALTACTHQVEGLSCSQQYDGKTDSDGVSVLQFSPGCTVVAGFCPACSAHWHVTVARNMVRDVRRIAAAVEGWK